MVNLNIMLLCRYDGRITRQSGAIVDYEGGKTALTKTVPFVSVAELKQLVSRACGFIDGEFEVSLSWMMPSSKDYKIFELVSLHTRESLVTTFDFFKKLNQSKFLEIIVTTKKVGQVAPVTGSAATGGSNVRDVVVSQDVPESGNAGSVDKIRTGESVECETEEADLLVGFKN